MSSTEQRIRNALAAEAELWRYSAEERLSDRRQRPAVPGWLVAGATAAAILVVVAGVLWAVQTGSETEARLESAAISAPAPIEVGPFVKVAGDSGEFGVEPIPEEPDQYGDIIATAEIAAAAGGERGVVAVGNLNGSAGGVGAIWFSSDGTQWQRVPHEDALFGAVGEVPNTMIVDVAADQSGFLAVGVRFAEPRERVVWRSLDGLSWSRGEGPGLDAAAVTSTDFGWTVVGSDGLHGGVWNSTDGLTWESAPSPVFVSDTHDINLQDIAHDGDRFVAVGGESARDIREERPIIWISDDAAVWERVGDAGDVFDIPIAGGIRSIASGPAGFAAIGEERVAEGDDPGFGVIWHSPDGLEWESVRLGPLGSGRPLSITASNAGYVVYGFLFDGRNMSSRLWTSTDGLTWDVVDPEGLEPHLPQTALAIERRLLIFGSLERSVNADGDVFYGTGAVWEAGL
jgi:hypothetical protein